MPSRDTVRLAMKGTRRARLRRVGPSALARMDRDQRHRDRGQPIVLGSDVIPETYAVVVGPRH
jgi:hypothetical protein